MLGRTGFVCIVSEELVTHHTKEHSLSQQQTTSSVSSNHERFDEKLLYKIIQPVLPNTRWLMNATETTNKPDRKWTTKYLGQITIPELNSIITSRQPNKQPSLSLNTNPRLFINKNQYTGNTDDRFSIVTPCQVTEQTINQVFSQLVYQCVDKDGNLVHFTDFYMFMPLSPTPYSSSPLNSMSLVSLGQKNNCGLDKVKYNQTCSTTISVDSTKPHLNTSCVDRADWRLGTVSSDRTEGSRTLGVENPYVRFLPYGIGHAPLQTCIRRQMGLECNDEEEGGSTETFTLSEDFELESSMHMCSCNNTDYWMSQLVFQEDFVYDQPCVHQCFESLPILGDLIIWHSSVPIHITPGTKGAFYKLQYRQTYHNKVV